MYQFYEDLDAYTLEDLRQRRRRELRKRKSRRTDIYDLDRRSKRTRVGSKRRVADYLLFEERDEFELHE